MKTALFSTVLLAAFVTALPARAQDVRFDVQSFRPSATPQDLVMVEQSRPLAHLSAAGGFFLNYSLDPLVLVRKDTSQKALSIVGNRLQLDAMAVVGLFNWIELGVDMPLVLAQTSDNLQAIGSEGFVRSFVPGDLRLSSKVALPYLRREPEAEGFGAALTFGLSFPTGIQDAFASDGAVSVAPGLVFDYRFKSGILLSSNAGLWTRPSREFYGLQLGNMATFGVGTEVPLIRRWGITGLAAVSGGAILQNPPPGQRRASPTEFLMGFRWYSPMGLTFTFGGDMGCGCSFSAPTLRGWSSVIWVPGKTAEYAALERFKNPPAPPPPPPPPVDPDHDGVIGEQDKCPDQPGPVENHGCPDMDRDRDGIVDRLDACPDIPQGASGRGGCPLARIEGNQILILDQVHFATDQDVILEESSLILQSVAQILKEHPEIERLRIEGHTDPRASNVHNMELSRHRAASVARFLINEGIDPTRLRSEGFGFHRPVSGNDTDQGMALNRRVDFIIERLRGSESGDTAVKQGPPAEKELPPTPPSVPTPAEPALVPPSLPAR